MTGAEYLIQQGERKVTLRLLMVKFGIDPERAHSLLDRVPDNRISDIAERLLVVNSLAELDLPTDH